MTSRDKPNREHRAPRISYLEVPRQVAICPECYGPVAIQTVEEWETATGIPTEAGTLVGCVDDMENLKLNHRYWLCDWQGINSAVYRWMRKTLELTNEEDP